MKPIKIKGDYSLLKRKVFIQTIGLAVVAFIFIIGIYIFVWAGRGANFTVSMIQFFGGRNYEDAVDIYVSVIRNNASVIIIVAVGIAFIILIRFSLIWFTRYFNEISRGINELAEQKKEEIILPRELRAIEAKLNAVRASLEEKKQEALLAEQRKNDLVVYLAHDIRTPLTSVIGYLSLLDESKDLPIAQREKYTHITLEKANQLEKLANEFFEITRYNFTQPIIQKKEIDLYYMMVQLMDEFYPLMVSKGNKAVLNASEQLTIQGDSSRLARAFGNILKNAVSYSNPDTDIIITAIENDLEVEVSFQSTGQTIPPEKLSAIFDKFYRLDESRTTQFGGAGLGLPIAKEIVQLHGGIITASSENEKTLFTVKLPKMA